MRLRGLGNCTSRPLWDAGSWRSRGERPSLNLLIQQQHHSVGVGRRQGHTGSLEGIVGGDVGETGEGADGVEEFGRHSPNHNPLSIVVPQPTPLSPEK